MSGKPWEIYSRQLRLVLHVSLHAVNIFHILFGTGRETCKSLTSNRRFLVQSRLFRSTELMISVGAIQCGLPILLFNQWL